MTVNPDGTVWLDEGETIPVACGCGELYQPPAGTMASACPVCNVINIHEEQEWERVRPTEDKRYKVSRYDGRE